MTAAMLEHTNLTVSDPQKTANWMCGLFGWHVRWQGDAIAGGHTIHVGTETHYLALYTPGQVAAAAKSNYTTVGGLNHIAVVVPDITEMEKRVSKFGFEPVNHADYEPGERFYFHDHDGIEFEIVSYA